MCFSMYLCNHLINATYVMASLCAAGYLISFQHAAKKKKNTMYISYIRVLMASPFHRKKRKVLNQLKFALLREKLPQKIRIIQNSI